MKKTQAKKKFKKLVKRLAEAKPDVITYILRALQDAGAPMMFIVIVNMVARHPALTKRIAQRGYW